jgi:hypothetical protein
MVTPHSAVATIILRLWLLIVVISQSERAASYIKGCTFSLGGSLVIHTSYFLLMHDEAHHIILL